MCFLGILVALLVVLLLAGAITEWPLLFWLMGLSNKGEVLKYLGIGIAGVLLMLQAVIANRRAQAMQQAAEAQLAANKHTEVGQRQERLKNAIEHLGHHSGSVRMGGAYELFHLAQDTPQLGQTVLDILCGHIRTQTHDGDYLVDYETTPSEEIQGLLNLLFRQNYEVFRGLIVDLKGSWLKGSDFREAHLSEAILTGVQMQGADLGGAELQGADLCGAQLQTANLHQANLKGADLWGADLQGSDLQEARLQGANLQQAGLQGADLQDAWMQGATLHEAQLQGAGLKRTRLHGVRPPIEEPTAESQRGIFVERMLSGVDRDTELDLVTFEGGLTKKELREIRDGLPTDAVDEIADKLRIHLDKDAVYQLSADSEALIGAYTSEEARRWIEDYPETPDRNHGYDVR